MQECKFGISALQRLLFRDVSAWGEGICLYIARVDPEPEATVASVATEGNLSGVTSTKVLDKVLAMRAQCCGSATSFAGKPGIIVFV